MKLWFFIICLGAINCLSAQNLFVEGTLSDEDHNPIPFANISLYVHDTIFYKGATSTKAGKFKLTHIEKDDYKVKISYVGYCTEEIGLYQLEKNLSLGTIILRPEEIGLSDIVVVADKQRRKADRLIILPTLSQLAASSTSLDLLSEMMLPGLMVNTVDRSVKVEGKTPEFQINGRKVQLSQVEALIPGDILRVEYIDRPGVSYDPNVNAVINYITRQVESGLLFSLNLQNALTTGFGNDGFSLKLNHKKSEFALSYDLLYRDYSQRKKSRWENYIQPDLQSFERKQIGIESPFSIGNHGVTFSYNLSEPDRYVFNAIVRTTLNDRKANDRGSLVEVNNILEMSNYEKTKMSFPEVDLYYSRRLTATQQVSLNVVGGYVSTHYQRDYREKGDTLYMAMSDTKGKKLGFIGEIKYENRLADKFTFTAGVKEDVSKERNYYYEANNKLIKQLSSFTYLYAQAVADWKKMNYIVGLAGAIHRYKVWEDKGHAFFAFRPSVILTYRFNPKSSLQYLFLVSSNNPDISYLNDIRQSINSVLVTKGNVDLKPYRSYFNMLTYSYFNKSLYSQIRLRHAYHAHPIMDDNFMDESSGLYVNTFKNQGDLQEYNASVYLKYGPFLHDIVTLQATGNFSHLESKGARYHHALTNCWFYFQGTFSYKRMSLLVSATTRSKALWGEIVTEDEVSSSVVLQYNKQPFVLGIGMSFPFSSAWTAGSKSLSEVTPYRSQTCIKDNGQMLFLKFSWNMAIGRKYKAGMKTLYNEGREGNILKVPTRN